jgi:mRNA interferase RelE/StbE
MSEYTITVARSARRELESLDAEVARRVLAKIEALARQPRPHGCKKIRGPSNLWRIRAGDYRIIYDINDGNRVVDVVIVRHRGDVYR